jgi:hypothetical protein
MVNLEGLNSVAGYLSGADGGRDADVLRPIDGEDVGAGEGFAINANFIFTTKT